jgi:hypothetical protein
MKEKDSYPRHQVDKSSEQKSTRATPDQGTAGLKYIM